MVTYGDSSSTVAPAWRASTRLTSVTPPWNRSTSAKTSTRLQVASTMASLTWSVPTSSCRALTVSSAPIANCSSSATGAVWWLTPTASRLTSPPRRRSSDAFAGLLCPWVSSRARSRSHLHRRRGRAALLAEEREDLQFDGEVDLADVDPRGRGQRHRREVQDAPPPGRGQPVADRLGDVGRCRDDADRGRGGGHHLVGLGHRPHRLPTDPPADPLGGGVEEPDEPEPAAAEAGVVGQGRAQVADPDQHAGASLLDTEDPGDAVPQRGHLVARPADPAGAQVREVLAQPGRVDTRRRGELTRGHVAAPAVGQTREHAQVHGQPGDGGLRDPGPGWGHGPLLAGARRPRALRSCAVARPRRLGHVALHKRSRSEVRRVPDAVERHRGPRRSAAPRTPREPLVNAGTKSLGGHQAAPQRRHAL